MRRQHRRPGGSLARARSVASAGSRPQTLGAVAGSALAASVFAPWYRADLGGVFTPGTLSGWSAGLAPQGVLVLALLIAVCSTALLADQRGAIDMHIDTADRLAWVVLVAAVLALVLVAGRLVLPPEPREFFARDWGIYVALAAGMGALLSGISMRFVYS